MSPEKPTVIDTETHKEPPSLASPTVAIALPPVLQKFLDELRRTGRLPAAPLSPAERAAKLKKRAERKAERDRKRDNRRRARR